MINKEACTFCDILSEPQSAFDAQQSIGEGNVTIMPALGMMVPGYFLSVTREHLTSYSQLKSPQLEEALAATDIIREKLSDIFGEYITVESGSDNVASQCGSGGCIDHAHQHLVPATDVGIRMRELLPWKSLEQYEDIINYRGSQYIYLGLGDKHYVLPSQHLPSQWMRRQLAELRQLPSWDWVVDPGQKNLKITLQKLEDTAILSRLVSQALQNPLK